MRAQLPLLLVLSFALAGCGHGIIVQKDVPYGEAGGQKLLLDIFRPADSAPGTRAALIEIHGGAWSAGDKSEFSEIGEELARRGYVVFSINYRLVTDTSNRWPAQIEDARRAVQWVRAHAVDYNIDPQRVGAMGGSAGGHIVACLGVSDVRATGDPALDRFSSRPDCVLMLAGPTDLTDDFARKVAEGEWCQQQVDRLLGGPASSHHSLALSASPLFHVDFHTAPTLIVQGRTDTIVPVDHAERFAAALSKAGVKNTLVILKGGHDLGGAGDLEKLNAGLFHFLQEQLPP